MFCIIKYQELTIYLICGKMDFDKNITRTSPLDGDHLAASLIQLQGSGEKLSSCHLFISCDAVHPVLARCFFIVSLRHSNQRQIFQMEKY